MKKCKNIFQKIIRGVSDLENRSGAFFVYFKHTCNAHSNITVICRKCMDVLKM